MRVFFDTNVFVAAFATRGLCADLFEVVLLGHELVVGERVLGELERNLRSKLKLTPARVREVAGLIRERATVVVASTRPVRAMVDPDDAAVLGEALEAAASVFVTGDAKVLAVGHVGDMAVLSPRAFWEWLRAPGR